MPPVNHKWAPEDKRERGADESKNTSDSGPTLSDVTRDLGVHGKGLVEGLESAGREAAEQLTGHVKKRPAVTLGAAVAAGYVLGGGLPSSFVGLATKLALRGAVGYAFKTLVADSAAVLES